MSALIWAALCSCAGEARRPVRPAPTFIRQREHASLYSRSTSSSDQSPGLFAADKLEAGFATAAGVGLSTQRICDGFVIFVVVVVSFRYSDSNQLAAAAAAAGGRMRRSSSVIHANLVTCQKDAVSQAAQAPRRSCLSVCLSVRVACPPLHLVTAIYVTF